MVEEMELLFTKEGMKVRKRVSMPFTGEDWHEKLVSYEEIARRDGIKLTVGKIEPEIERGVLKGLKFHVTDYSVSSTEKVKVIPRDSNKPGIEIQGDFVECKFAKDVLVETANWLIDENLLKEENIPMDVGGYKRYLINTKKVHKDGSSFHEAKTLKNGMFIETHESKKNCIEYAKRMLEKVGLSRDDLRVIGFSIE
ncbi:MAG TPA: hypothetical protein VMW67_00215 [Desulfobacteria bacterium]|nr:hypothetical protein [Desulfobacteria bacterium]